MRSLSGQPPDGCFCCAVHAVQLKFNSQFISMPFIALHRIASHRPQRSPTPPKTSQKVFRTLIFAKSVDLGPVLDICYENDFFRPSGGGQNAPRPPQNETFTRPPKNALRPCQDRLRPHQDCPSTCTHVCARMYVCASMCGCACSSRKK